jgi:hypothetical protein
MKLKKILIVILLFLLMPVMVGCDEFWTFGLTTTTQTEVISTLPTLVNGTITYQNSDYDEFPAYQSDTYEITDIDIYNDVLLDTQDYIRHANIEIQSHLFEEVRIAPWSTSTELQEVGISSGSGFVFMEDDQYYYAITNYHVIDPEEYIAEYKIKAFGDEEFVTCEVVVSDSEIDLAVVKFTKNSRTDVTIIDIYGRLFYKFTPGELVLAVGNPLDVNDIVTFGEYYNLEAIQNVDYEVIYHNAQIDEGSSGGALVDVDGNLIGVNTWGFDSDEVYSFAIPNYIVYMFLINNGILD